MATRCMSFLNQPSTKCHVRYVMELFPSRVCASSYIRLHVTGIPCIYDRLYLSQPSVHPASSSHMRNLWKKDTAQHRSLPPRRRDAMLTEQRAATVAPLQPWPYAYVQFGYVRHCRKERNKQ